MSWAINSSVYTRDRKMSGLWQVSSPQAGVHHRLWEWPGEFPVELKERLPGPGRGGARLEMCWLKARRGEAGEWPGSPPRTDEVQTPTSPWQDSAVSMHWVGCTERSSSNRTQFVLLKMVVSWLLGWEWNEKCPVGQSSGYDTNIDGIRQAWGCGAEWSGGV